MSFVESERGENPYEHKFFAAISKGVLRGQVGPQAKPGGAAYDGTIESDGSMVVIAKGITSPTSRPKPNADFTYQLGGRLEGSQGSAIRLDRTCDVRFAKQPAGAGPMVAPAVAASPAAGAPVHRFDGLWTTTVVCEPTGDALGWSNKFVAQVKDLPFKDSWAPRGSRGGLRSMARSSLTVTLRLSGRALPRIPKPTERPSATGRPAGPSRFERMAGSKVHREAQSAARRVRVTWTLSRSAASLNHPLAKRTPSP